MLVVLLKKLIIIPDISNLVTKTALTAIENKISNISNLAAKTALTIVENKIPDISNLATKAALTIFEKKKKILILVISLRTVIILEYGSIIEYV